MLNETVADYTFALLLALARRVHEGHAWMVKGEWKIFWGSDVSGKTLGIIGCGRIGLAVARRAAGFNLRLLGYDLAPCPQAEALGVKMVSLDELLGESDYVTLHAALTPQSRGLIGEGQLRKMKRTAHLINAGRGALIDEAALVRALQEGWIAGAALDTFTKEPLPSDHPLRSAPNVLLTPHLASFARENGMRVSLAAAQAILDLMNGRPPQSLVNPGVLSSPNSRAPLRAA
jgi:phosphoglycerate dehydrogenase-like enzyme